MANAAIGQYFTNERAALDFFTSEMDFLISWYRSNYESSCESNREFRKKICAAVSGGSDSMALLAMAANWAKIKNFEVLCVTVDHKLRKESQEEADFVTEFCKSINVNHHILEWRRMPLQEIQVGKLESMAREARYALLADFCLRNSISFLLTGHTWNDQLETFEMRKSSGSSNLGLAGMSRIRTLSVNETALSASNVNNMRAKFPVDYDNNVVMLLRPILHCTKEYLKSFLVCKGIAWKNDSMNDQEIFKRVFYRKQIASYNDERLQKYYNEIKRLGKIRHNSEMRAVNFLKDEVSCTFLESGNAVVNFQAFMNEETNVQMEILRRIIWHIGEKKYAFNITEDILQNIIAGKINTLGRCLLKVNKKAIFISRENRNPNRRSGVPTKMDTMDTNAATNMGIGRTFAHKARLFDIFLW